MKKTIIPIVIAIVLIILIGGVSIGVRLFEKYSYSRERADLNEYFAVTSPEDVAIILGNEMIEERARLIDGIYYLEMPFVHQYFNDRFYEDKKENLLLYALPDDVVRCEISSNIRQTKDGSEDMGYVIARYEGDTLLLAVDYLKQYANFSCEAFTEPNRLQIDIAWDEIQVGEIAKDTQVRILGGVKSEILKDVAKGERVTVLEQMENWSKVKTADSVIGYVENKRLTDVRAQKPVPVTDYVEPVYTALTRDYKINLGWHVVAGPAGNDTLESVTAPAKGLNVISPTWFKLSDNQGGFTSFASSDYVSKAHGMGLEVWALIENIEYKDSIDMYAILSSTSTRTKLIADLVSTVEEYGIDGINVDFEQISVDCGEHFVQFIRELSIPCREKGIVLSVDNYVPRGYNDHYDRKEQGLVADYVIIMGYDEHFAGSSEAGSVASIDFVEEGIQKTVDQVPAQKVINAVPFYTRIWETTGSSISSQAVGMEMAQEYVSAHGIVTEWNEAACQNYGEYTSGDTLFQVWLEDEDSIRVKLNIMEKYGIGGVASWRLGFETPQIWDVIGEYLSQ